MFRKERFTFACVVLCITSNFLAEARIKVLTTLDDETVYIVREKPIIVNIDSPSKGMLIVSKPINACSPVHPPPMLPAINPQSPQNNKGNITYDANNASLSKPVKDWNDDFAWILLVSWSASDQCSLRVKAENAAAAGFTAILFPDPSDIDNDPDSEAYTPLLTPLTSSITSYNYQWTNEAVYACTINPVDWDVLRRNFTKDEFYLSFEDSSSMNGWFTYFVVGILVIGAVFFTIGLSYVLVQLLVLILIWIRESIVSRIQQARRDRRRRLPPSQLKKIPIQQWNSDMLQDICSICLESFVETDRVRILPCAHVFHQICIDPWLLKQRRKCPNCKRRITFPDENTESDLSSDDERTPLLRRNSSTRESSSASASASPRHSRSQQQNEHAQRQAPQMACGQHLSHGISSDLNRFLVLGAATSNNPPNGYGSNPAQLETQHASTSSPELTGSINGPLYSSPNDTPTPQDLKGKVDQLCARMESVGRKIKKKVKQNQSSKQHTSNTDSSSDMSASAIQPVLVSVAVEPNRTNNNNSYSNDDDNDNTDSDQSHDPESHKKCKTERPSAENNANLNDKINGASSSSGLNLANSQTQNLPSSSNQGPVNIPEENDAGLKVKVVPDCPSTSPRKTANNSENNFNNVESTDDTSILQDLNA